MTRWFSAIVSILIACAPALAKGPEVNLVDSRLSVSADAIPIGRLLQLVDLATGMKSRVPPELANRNISVRFSDLSVVDGVRKMFQGQPLDYVVIEGQGIIVTAASQAVTGTEPVPTYNQAPQASQQGQPFQQFQPPQPAEPPFGQDFQPQPVPGMINNPQQQQQQQPATSSRILYSRRLRSRVNNNSSSRSRHLCFQGHSRGSRTRSVLRVLSARRTSL
jgi:hypothetical protein